MNKRYKVSDLNRDQLLKLATAHIKMYQLRADSCHPAVNIKDTLRYKRIWVAIEVKAHSVVEGVKMFRDSEDIEIQDALDSLEYDQLLGLDRQGDAK